MKILAVDTALGACSVAVLDGDRTVATILEIMERGHAEALAPMVQSAMYEGGLSFTDLERLAVTTGPGTFTGQRVGLAFMRGLRLGLKLPLIGVTTLRAMAAAAVNQNGAIFGAALHDAKRGEVYAALYRRDGTEIEPPAILPLEAAVQMIRNTVAEASVALAGTAAMTAGERLAGAGAHPVVTPITAPNAIWVGRIAATAPAPRDIPRPLYLRPPDARLPPQRS